MTSTYEFADAPLTPSIFATLVPQLFSGKVADLQEIRQAVRDHHLQNGGLEQTSTNPAKKAMSNLRNAGQAELVSKDRYRISHVQNEGIQKELDAPSFHNSAPPEKKDYLTSTELTPAKWVGQGKEIVYVYGYPAYRKLAEREGKKSWPLKIGMSKTGLNRVWEQVGTAIPESPEILLAIKTDNAKRLERAIHENLKFADCQLADARGTEWFETNVRAIEATYCHLKSI
ncbi:MAG: GIY-YIG nuclease family protein [Shimia sp.]|nr:GIY-YIG nuclease family protein [Shimia sp.]